MQFTHISIGANRRVIAAAMAASLAAAGVATAGADTAHASSLSSQASDWDTTKHIAESGWKELNGQDGLTSSMRQATDFASSQATPHNIAGSAASAQANPAGAAAGAVGVGSAAKPLWDTFKTDAANDWKVGTTFEIYTGLTIGAIALLAIAGGVVAADNAGLIDLPDLDLPALPELPQLPQLSS